MKIKKEFIEMGRGNYTKKCPVSARPILEGPASGWKVRRGVLLSRTKIRARAHEHFKHSLYSSPGRRLEALAIELNQVLSGQPMRVEFLERALCGIGTVIPLRGQSPAPMPSVEVVTMGQPS